MPQDSDQNASNPGIGIDFGTSNSAAAVFDGTELRLVKLAGSQAIMPSANYIQRDFSIAIGHFIRVPRSRHEEDHRGDQAVDH